MSGAPPEARAAWAEATRLIRTAGGPEVAAAAAAAGPAAPVAVNPPVQRGSTVILPDARALYTAEVTYGRQGLATQDALCAGLAELERAEAVRVFPSGAAAVSAALLAVLAAGDEVLVSDSVYGPTRRFCTAFLGRFGVSARFIDPRISAEDLAALFTPATRAVMLESPGSLTFEVADTPALAAACRSAGVLSVMDNTWAAGVLFKPLDHGVDLSVQALTKYVAGHADVFMGSVAVRDASLAAKLDAVVHDMGWAVSPDDAYTVLRGLRTLALRMERHGAAGLEVARWLQGRSEVVEVLHPALPASPDHRLWRRDFSGACGLFGVVLQPSSADAVRALLDELQLFGLGFSWGGFESLAVNCDPQLKRTATPPRLAGPLLRLHVGLEAVGDLTADLDRGLAAWRAAD